MIIKSSSIIVAILFIASIALISGCCCCTGSQSYTSTPNPTSYPASYATYYPPANNVNVLWDETKQVEKGGWLYSSAVLNRGTTINIDISTTDGGAINFMVMDAPDYDKYSQGMNSFDTSTWQSYITEKSLVQKSFQFTTPTTDRYYLVVDNSGRISGSSDPTGNVNVHIYVTY